MLIPPVAQGFKEGVGDEWVGTGQEMGLEVWGGRIGTCFYVNIDEEGAVV